MPATNETFVPKAFVAAQGAALFRALSHDQLASLRHFEVTVLERVAGSRRTTLQPRSWNYIAVTDAALLLVARFGKARSMVAIPLAHITQVVEDEDSVGAFNEEGIGDAAKRFFVTHRPPCGPAPPQVTKLEPAEREVAGGEGRSSRAGAPAGARQPRDVKRVSRGQTRQSASGALASKTDNVNNSNSSNSSNASPGQPEEENLSIITMESPSLLFFHLWQAWMQVHTRRSLARSLSRLPTPQAPNPEDSTPARRRQLALEYTRHVQSQLTQACCRAQEEGEAACDVSPCYMTQHSLSESSMAARRGLFASEAAWAAAVLRARAAAFLASFVGSTRRPARSLVSSSTSTSSAHKPLQAQLQQPVGQGTARPSFVRSLSFQQGVSAVMNRRRTSDAVISENPELLQLSMLRKIAQGRMSPRALWDHEPELQHQTAATLNWEHMALGLLCIHARTRATAILEWLGGMLDNSSSVRARLQIYRYEGTQYSVQELISTMFALNIPEEPSESAPTKRSSNFVQTNEGGMSHSFMDVLVGVLYSLDNIAEQAGAEGILSDRYYVWTHLSNVAEPHLRPKVCAMFVRLVDLMIDCPKSMNTALVYRLAYVMHVIILALPFVAGYINEEFDEVSCTKVFFHMCSSPCMYPICGAMSGCL